MNQSTAALLPILRHNLPDWATGFAGRGLQLHHLGNLADLCRQEPILAETAWQAAYWRWQLYPWEKQTIDLCNALSKLSRRPPLPNWTSQLPTLSATHINGLRTIAAGESNQTTELWRLADANDKVHPVFFGELALFSLQCGDWNLVDEMLHFADRSTPHTVFFHIQALRAFCSRSADAVSIISRLPADLTYLSRYLHAELLHPHDQPAAVSAFLKLWREIPWHVNLSLKLHSLISTHPQHTIPGQTTAICIYSWNNADLLQQTLLSLSQSDLGNSSLLFLDNGSSDHTPEVVRTAADLFGNRLKSYRLPTNIGAPAARNWLLRHPEASAFDTVVFLDDDVLLPPDWLSNLSGRFLQAGKHVIVGCRIMNQAPRKTVQMADVNLLDIEPDGDFLIANAGSGELDLGLHDYTRPCLSVTGCCHMMDRRHAEALGGFDLRFGPSQFDDFDLDLRNALDGGHALYIGNSAIKHCQRSSMSQADNEAKIGHIQGNMIKLNSKYSIEQKHKLLRMNQDLLWSDLLAKVKDLENT